MNNIFSKIKCTALRSILPALPLGGMLLLASCQDSAWDDHYGIQEGTANQTLMEVLSSNGEYSSFLKVLDDNKMLPLLTGDQSFTVWAPTNEAMQSFNLQTDTVEKFIQNHINRYVYGAADLRDTNNVRIMMLNGKMQDFSYEAGKYYFNGIEMNGETAAKNGVIHSIGSIAQYNPNLYQSLSVKENNCDSLGAFIKSFDVNKFEVTKSTVIGKNEKGQLVYDSVFTYSSKFMKNYGDIYKEDSVYTMVMPDNTAWGEAYASVSKYFRTFGDSIYKKDNTTTYKPDRKYAINDALADSLTRGHTKEAITRNLLFRKNVEFSPAAEDYLISTAGNVFYAPAHLVEGATDVAASNGKIKRISAWTYESLEAFFDTIEVEAESTTGRNAYNSIETNKTVTNTEFLDSVSGSKYLLIDPTSATGRNYPAIQFSIPNTLAATYNVYCVFLPAQVEEGEVIADSALLQYEIYYVHEDGVMKSDGTITPTKNQTSSKNITKMFVKQITLPFANFTSSVFKEKELQDKDCVKIRIQPTSKSKSRVMRIDKIVFEPVTLLN